MTVSQAVVTLGQDHCGSRRCCSDIVPRLQTDRRGNGSVNSLSVRLFQMYWRPRVRLQRACLPLSLRLCLALVQSNYNLLLVVSTSAQMCPLSSHSLHFSHLKFWAALFSGASRTPACPRISTHCANSQLSWVLVCHKDTCQAGFI